MRSFFFLYVGIDCYKIYSLELLLLNPISFSMLYLHFHLFQNIFWFPFWLHLWLIGYSEVYCLNFTYLKIFQFFLFFFFKLLSSFILFGPIKMLGLLCDLLCDLFWWTLCVYLEECFFCCCRMFYILYMYNILYMSVRSICSIVQVNVSLLIFYLDDPCYWKWVIEGPYYYSIIYFSFKIC